MNTLRIFATTITTAYALAIGSIAQAASGDLYVSAAPLVLKVTVGGTTSPFSSSTVLPSGVAFDHSGNLFAADATANLIVKLTPDGSQSTFLGTGLSAPRGLAFGAAGNLYVADSGTNSVLQITPAGVSTTFATGLSAPRGLAFDALGNLYVANSGNNTIVRITPDGTKTIFVSTGLNVPFGLAFDAEGTLFVSNMGSNAIVKVDAAGVGTSFVSTGLNAPEGLAFDASGNLFVADFGSGAILKITPGGTVTIDVPGLIGPQFLALLPSTHWKDTQQAAIQATGLAPSDDRESAIKANLADGNYTAIVRGAGNSVGTALVEVYKAN